MISTDPWVWISAILTIFSFTLLYGDNKFFRFAQYTYTAVVVGHSVVVGVQTLQGRFSPLISGQKPMLLISLILGLMVLFVVWRPYAWIASIPYAVIIGVGTGLMMRATLQTDVIGSVRAVIAETGKIFIGSPYDQFGYLIRVTFTIGTMFYFLFTVFVKGTGSKPVSYLRDFGKYALLIYLGLSLGNSAMQYSGLGASAINRLLRQWLGLGG
jgi:hypothetical protein